jgi:hypothetical protein
MLFPSERLLLQTWRKQIRGSSPTVREGSELSVSRGPS